MKGKLALFANDKKGNEKAPDARGLGEIDGAKVKASAWWAVSKAGQEYLSVVIEPDQQRQDDPPRPTPQGGTAQAGRAPSRDTSAAALSDAEPADATPMDELPF